MFAKGLRRATRMTVAAACFGLIAAGIGLPSVAAQAPVADATARGAQVYGQYCVACHGVDMVHPSGSASFDLRAFPAAQHDRFINAVLNGKGAMPAWDGTVTRAQAEDLWAYVSSAKVKPAAAVKR